MPWPAFRPGSVAGVRRDGSAGSRFRIGLPLLVLAGSVITFALVDDQSGRLVLPVLVLTNTAALYFAVLWRRDGELPLFEVGSLWVAATFVYSAMPFVNVVVDGLQWGPESDARLQAYGVDLDVLTSFAWRYVVYTASFVAVYLAVRGRHTAAGVRLEVVPRSLLAAFAVVFGLELGFEQLMRAVYGLNLHVVYNDLPVTHQPPDMSYIGWQVTLMILGCVLVAQHGLLLLLIRRWNHLGWRLVIVTGLCYGVASVALHMGARGAAVRLILAFVVLYHRFVRPMRPLWLGVGSAAVLVGFLVHGIVRIDAVPQDGLDVRTVLTSNNEFQVLFATAYDLYQRNAAGTLPPVPWQIYLSDLYMIVPSQLLPFYKWDPAIWYLDVIGARDTGVGFMFGVMAQAVLGFDWLELFARGALLGLLFAWLHRWYVRHARQFWPTLFYLFVTIWSYYTFRATSFYIVYFVVYQFIPVMVVVSVLCRLLGGRLRSASRA